MSHRHHPLVGQQFEVVSEGQNHLAIRLPDGTSMRILRDWTDIDGKVIDEAPSKGTIFTTEALRDLIDLIVIIKRD